MAPFFRSDRTVNTYTPDMISSLRLPTTLWVVLSTCALLSGCEIPFLSDDAAKKAAEMEAEGKAIGSACRHALRGVEDCYALNPKALKSAVFNGWKEMDQYMRENNIEGQASVVPAPPPPPRREPTEVVEEDKPRKKSKAAPADKH